MIHPRSSKLVMRVRFPSSAPSHSSWASCGAIAQQPRWRSGPHKQHAPQRDWAPRDLPRQNHGVICGARLPRRRAVRHFPLNGWIYLVQSGHPLPCSGTSRAGVKLPPSIYSHVGRLLRSWMSLSRKIAISLSLATWDWAKVVCPVTPENP